MGKSIRCKLKKRLRTAKRQRVDVMVYTPQLKEKHEQLQRVIQGCSVTLKKPKNAFKYPEAEGACFPQHELVKPIDYRAEKLPIAQYAFRGNRRKYSPEEQEYMKNLQKTCHPKMEVLAGGGTILAKTGKRVSLQEAALEQEANAAAMAIPASSAAAVAAAIAEDAAAGASSSSTYHQETRFLPMTLQNVNVLLHTSGDTWLVHNGELKAETRGLGHRRSKQLEDKIDDRSIWGSFVQGTPTGDGWLQIKVQVKSAPGAANEAEDEDMNSEEDKPAAAPDPTNSFDHTRKPVVKDVRRAKRAVAPKPKPRAKKGKASR